MSKSARAPKPQGENAALKRRIERAEAITSALVADVEVLKQRMDKVEVVKAGPQETDREPYKGEPDPNVPPPG